MSYEAEWQAAVQLEKRGHPDAALAHLALVRRILAERNPLPPVEIIERISRLVEQRDPVGAVKVLLSIRDEVRKHTSPRAARTARHLTLSCARVCLRAGDLEAAAEFVEQAVGNVGARAEDVAVADHHEAREGDESERRRASAYGRRRARRRSR